MVTVKIYYHPGVLSLDNAVNIHNITVACILLSSENIIMVLLILFIQDGKTPLLWASFYGHTAVVELLLLNNADVSICDKVYMYMYVRHES